MMTRQGSFKRGNMALEMVVVLVVLFIFSIVGLLIYNTFSDLAVDVMEDFTDENATASLEKQVDEFPGFLDGAFVMILGLLWMGSLALAFFIDSHPVFLVLTLVLVPAILIVGGSLGNFSLEIFNEEGGAATLPMTYFILDNYGKMIVAYIATYLIALYAKSRLE